MKRFKITYDYWWEAEFDVDVPKAAIACKESLDFFGDPITREDDSDEEIIFAFLKLWFRLLIEESMNRSVERLIEWSKEQEGMVPLNGNHGIKLISCESWEFQYDDAIFEAKEVK